MTLLTGDGASHRHHLRTARITITMAGTLTVTAGRALVLNQRPGHRTRLLVRTGANYAPRAIGLLALPGGLADATYGVAMLRAIARRAETPEPGRT
jgi:hypothetical protein